MTTAGDLPNAGVVGNLILWWVRLYTAGLAPHSRGHRLGQVRSDLWEHTNDRLAEGAGPALVGIEILGRAARGAPSDLLWRFQLEGPTMQLNIPIERIGGAFLLFLILAILIGVSVAGYDPAAEGFETELRRLADVSDWQVAVFTVVQVISGLGMVGGAVVLGLALRRYASTTATLSAAAMACAGLLVVLASVLYVTAADLADEWAAATPDHSDSVLTTARAIVFALQAMAPLVLVTLVLGISGFSIITVRHHLVPHWLGFVATGSVISVVAAGVSSTVTSDASWGFFMLTLLLVLLWLAVAGGSLLLGGSKSTPADGEQKTVGAARVRRPAE